MTEREQIRADIKRQLNSYRNLQAEQRQIESELYRLDLLMSTPSSPNLDGMPKSPGVSNPVETLVTKHIILEERYKEQIEKLVAAQMAIEDIIEGLEPTERRLARFRYIDGLTWEATCERICYSWMQTHRIHGRMLDKLVDAELKKRKASE